MYVCVCVYIYIYIYIYISIYICVWVCVCEYVYMYVHIYMHMYIYICMYTHMYIRIYIYLYMYVGYTFPILFQNRLFFAVVCKSIEDMFLNPHRRKMELLKNTVESCILKCIHRTFE